MGSPFLWAHIAVFRNGAIALCVYIALKLSCINAYLKIFRRKINL
jgi:hypothetical protein